MGEDNRKWIRAFSSLVNEVDSDAVNLCSKVRQLIEGRLLLLPVVGSESVGHELLQIRDICTRAPVTALDVTRPSRVLKPSPQIAQHVARNFDPERINFLVHHAYLDACGLWMEGSRFDPTHMIYASLSRRF